MQKNILILLFTIFRAQKNLVWLIVGITTTAPQMLRLPWRPRPLLQPKFKPLGNLQLGKENPNLKKEGWVFRISTLFKINVLKLISYNSKHQQKGLKIWILPSPFVLGFERKKIEFITAKNWLSWLPATRKLFAGWSELNISISTKVISMGVKLKKNA